MEKKFREYRMLLVCIFLFVIFLSAFLYYMMIHEKVKMIAMILFVFITSMLLLFRYKMVLFNDAMVVYEWKVFALLPVMIEYKDISSIEKVSKHRVKVHHQHITYVYVVDAQKFVDAYQEMKDK